MRMSSYLAVGCFFCMSLLGADGSGRLSSGEHDAHIRDVQLHYTVAGHGPLVFVCSPGWGAGSFYLQQGLAPLEKNFTLLFIDTRGSGKSSKPQDTARMSAIDMADDIEALRSYLSLDQIVLMGHSDSGAIALFYAERYPSKLAKLVVMDGVSYGHSAQDHQETENERRIRQRLASDARYKAALEPFKPSAEGDLGMMQVMQHSLPLFFADPDKNLPVFQRSIEGMMPSSFAAKTNSAANHGPQIDSTSRLGEIKVKTLIVVGKQDWVCPIMSAEDLHKAIAGSELVEIEGSGHFPWIEQPAMFFEAVNSFLKK